MAHAVFVTILASGLPLAGAEPQRGVNRIANKQWHVKYMGGPNLLKRATPVVLEISERTISYRAVGSRADQGFWIPVAAVTNVSDEVIEDRLSEKVFGPGEPDYINDLDAPCAERVVRTIPPGPVAAAAATGCFAGSLALEVPYAVLASVLSNIPFKDHFVRLKWQANGKDLEVVFKVSGKDHVALREGLERVTGEGRREEEPQGQAVQATIYDAPVTHIEEFDRKTTEAHVQQWLIDKCLDRGSERPSQSVSSTLDFTGSCAAIRESHDRLLAKPEGE
jgi:hypothetical protein